MKCQTRGEVQAYLDEELSASRMREIESHFGECPSCRALGSKLRSNRDFFQKKAPGLDLEIPRRIIRRGEHGRNRGSAWFSRRLPVPVPLLAMLCLAGAIAALLFIQQGRELRGLRLERLAERAQQLDSSQMTARLVESLNAFGKRIEMLVTQERKGMENATMIQEIKTMKKEADIRRFFKKILEQLKEV